MSATSSEARTASAGRCAFWGREHAEPIERADHRAHRARRHLGVECGRLEPGMAEQGLDDADIDAVFQQMRREAVPQRVRPDPLGDLRPLGAFDVVVAEALDRLSRDQEDVAALYKE